MSVQTILQNITKLIITYEPGDVISLSEIITSLEQFRNFYKKPGTEQNLCAELIGLSRKELKDNSENFVQSFSKGIDLLEDAMESKKPLPEWKIKRIQEWLTNLSRSEVTETESAAGTINTKPYEQKDNLQQIDSDQLEMFISDCEERLVHAQDLILLLEQEPGNNDAIKELFRIFHTIKGECGFLKLSTLGLLAHNIETLFDLLRSGKITVTKQTIDLLLKGLDTTQKLIQNLKTGASTEYQQPEVLNFINSIPRVTNSFPDTVQTEDKNSTKKEETLQTYIKKQQDKNIEASTSSSQETKDNPEFKEKMTAKSETVNSVIKVKADKINYLVDMIGELLICLGQMKEDTEGLPQVRKIARTLQYGGMQLRTESVHTLFGTVRRIIRDTSLKVGKPVKGIYEGEDLEIDRNLIESLEEPLMHLIRNAIDHGIESAEERIRAGKPAEGTVRVAAERRGNNIVISVGDDGCGLNRKKILTKAIGKGIIRESDVQNMSDAAVYNLIFVSGFSTNDSVSLISGRGVGMDIVSEIVKKEKGYIRTESEPGKGTTFLLYFPLSTAIIDGLLVRTGENIFIIPVASVIESLKITGSQICSVASGVQVLNLRGEILPVISLAEIFTIVPVKQENIATVIENAEKEKFAVMSEEVLAKREVVIKNLCACFKNFKGINSGTVLPGGSIGFVLDIEQLITLGKENRTAKEALHE